MQIVKNTILIVFCAANAALWGGCNRPTSTRSVDSTQTVDAPLAVEQLLANPQIYAHSVLKVRGCLDSGLEKIALHPCHSQNPSQDIWLETVLTERDFSVVRRLYPEVKLPPATELLFQFDGARNSRAWKKLDASFSGSDIVLVGQFETGPGFGHLSAYMHELILVDVLDDKSNPTP